MAYVPPHRKNNGTGIVPSSPLSLETRRTWQNIVSQSFYTYTELRDCLGADHLHTLSESFADPNTLAAIVIHNGQHPNWPPTVLCKTNLQLLPDQNPSDTSAAVREYPLFAEATFRNRGRGKVFEFNGWWKIVGIEYLEPQSQELISMLDRKFSRPTRKARFGPDRQDQGKARTAEAWNDSLSSRWAMITLERNKARRDNPVRELAEVTQRYLRLREEQLKMQSPTQLDTETREVECSSVNKEIIAQPDNQRFEAVPELRAMIAY